MPDMDPELLALADEAAGGLRFLPGEFVWVSMSEIQPHDRNVNEGDLGNLADRVDRLGFYGTILVQAKTRTESGLYRILAGEHRWLELRRRGAPTAPCWVLDVDDDTALRILVGDNHSTRLGRDRPDDLAALLSELATSTTGLAGTGFDGDDLDALLADLVPPIPTQPPQEETPLLPARADPTTQPGDLWIFGEHRLFCGDATKRASYETLLGDERPGLVVTDPPYGVSHGEGVTDAKAIRGDLSQAAIPLSFASMLEHLEDDARLYLFGDSNQFAMYLGLFDHHLHAQPRVVVWVKDGFVLRQNGYHSQYELVYWGWRGKGGGPDHWYGDRKASDVWQVARDPNAEREHSTQKPVEVFRIPIERSSPLGGLVLDPFAGSGTAVVACEQLGRRARAMELDPAYCDVICHRWERLTGQIGERTHPEADGGT